MRVYKKENLLQQLYVPEIVKQRLLK